MLFDFGETLLNFGKVNSTQLFRQGARLSYDFLKKQDQPVGSFSCYLWRNLLSIRLRYLLSNIVKKDFDSLALLKKIGTKKGLRLTTQQWQHLAWLWYEPLSKVAKAEPKIKETLTELLDSGLKLGIVSNTFVNGSSLEKHLEQLDILDCFTVRLYSYEFRFRKPNLQIFKAAADRIGEAFENILYVGDRIDKDVKPALQLGMPTVLKAAYTNAGKETPTGAWRINHLSELPDLIKKLG